jgi:hypothetical protein
MTLDTQITLKSDPDDSGNVRRFVNEKVAADYIGLKPPTMQKMRYRGNGPPFAQFGRAIRYNLGDLYAWATSRTKRSTAQTGVTGEVRHARTP